MIETKANVIDIRKLRPEIIKNTTFAIDTNVLYWMHYTRCSETTCGYQLNVYPNFIESLINNNNKLVTTIYNMTELLYIIENNEYDIYCIQNNKDNNFNKKRFRTIVSERIKVKEELEAVVSQIKSLYEIKNFSIDILGLEDFVHNLDCHKCDDFDYLIIKYLSNNNINNIITDDADYTTMENINIYTANNNAFK